jgi:hypothetical protein
MAGDRILPAPRDSLDPPEAPQTLERTMSTSTDLADELIHAAIYDVALRAAKAAAVAEAPWIGWPVFSQMFDFMLNRFADWIYDALDKAVVFAIIDLETEAQRRAYDEAVAAFKQVLSPPTGVPDADAIAKAEAEFKKRLADLIRLHP